MFYNFSTFWLKGNKNEKVTVKTTSEILAEIFEKQVLDKKRQFYKIYVSPQNQNSITNAQGQTLQIGKIF